MLHLVCKLLYTVEYFWSKYTSQQYRLVGARGLYITSELIPGKLQIQIIVLRRPKWHYKF